MTRPFARRLGLAALLALAAAGARADDSWFRPLTGRTFERTPARVERGRYLAEGLLQCFLCHSDRDWTKPGGPPVPGKKYAGHVWGPQGRPWLVSPNLTPDPETGTGKWTDDMLARAIREGVGHDGRPLNPQMWSWAFRRLSDEDLASVVVYLRSLPPVRNPLPTTKLPGGYAEETQATLRPLTEPVPERDLSSPLARGRYLVEIADCAGCHTAWEAPRNPGLFGGGNPIDWSGHTAFSANLTPEPSGIPYYDQALFKEVMRTGRVKARVLDGAMPWIAFRNLNDSDLEAIFAFLQALPPVAHAVSNYELDTPGFCPVCKQTHGLGDSNRAPEIPRAAVDPHVFDDYVGRYVFEDSEDAVEVVRDGERLLWVQGKGRSELVPQSESRFRAETLEVPIRFVRGRQGQVTHILLEVEEIKLLRRP
jgi:mono/diheme cytochrome c family protein